MFRLFSRCSCSEFDASMGWTETWRFRAHAAGGSQGCLDYDRFANMSLTSMFVILRCFSGSQ